MVFVVDRKTALVWVYVVEAEELELGFLPLLVFEEKDQNPDLAIPENYGE